MELGKGSKKLRNYLLDFVIRQSVFMYVASKLP